MKVATTIVGRLQGRREIWSVIGVTLNAASVAGPVSLTQDAAKERNNVALGDVPLLVS